MEQQYQNTTEVATIPSGMAPAGLDEGQGIGQSPLLMDRVNSNSQYHLQDQQDIEGFIESMTYREPYQNRKLHENSVYAPKHPMANNLKHYMPSLGSVGHAGHLEASHTAGQHVLNMPGSMASGPLQPTS